MFVFSLACAGDEVDAADEEGNASEEATQENVSDLERLLQNIENEQDETVIQEQNMRFAELTGVEWLDMSREERIDAIEEFLLNDEEKYDYIITDDIVEEYSKVLRLYHSTTGKKYEVMRMLSEALDYNTWEEKTTTWYMERSDDPSSQNRLVMEVIASPIQRTIKTLLDRKLEQQRRRYDPYGYRTPYYHDYYRNY